MFKKLDRMTLKTKLNVSYSVVIGMMVISGIISLLALGMLFGTLSHYINTVQKADTSVKNCRIDLNVAGRNIREMALNTDSASYEGYRNTVQEMLDNVNNELKTIKESDLIDDSLYNEYESVLTSWGEIGYSIMEDIEAGKHDLAAERLLNECSPALEKVMELSEEIDKITDIEKSNAIKRSYLVAIAGVVFILIFVALAIILALTLSKRIITAILTPLREIESVAVELAAGNLHSNLEYRSDDEIGKLAHSLRKSIRILGSYIDDISRAMKEFSNGNFDVQPEVEWKGDFINILNSFMDFEKSMSVTIKGIQHVADEVTVGANKVAGSAMDLADGASEQAGVTEELAATIENVSERVARNAEDAKQVSQEVANVSTEILNGNGKVQEMVSSMSEIEETSNEISKIIATINEIASQTNLLALNASIEAARAGEAGKGFAVVASQVSTLADQSAEAAKESTTLIETSVKAVEKGMIIAKETAKQLENVVSGSEQITQKVDDIASALAEQSVAFDQINEGVDHINEVVQTNSAASEECAAASQEMSSESETLENLIRKFKVGKF